jgi:predicted phage terminase large subunit-like protein
VTESDTSTTSPWRIIVDRAVGHGGEALWPEYFTPRVLADLRRQLGQVLFSAQYLNEPLGFDDGLFRPEWIAYAPRPKTGGVVTQGVDPAISLRPDADEFALVTVAEGDGGALVVVDAFHGRLDFSRQIATIESMADRWRPARIVIETVAYQQALRQELHRRGHLPVRGVRPGESKAARALRLAARMEAGKVAFARGLYDLEAQLLAFPRGERDDLVDALVYAVDAAADASRPMPRRLRGV